AAECRPNGYRLGSGPLPAVVRSDGLWTRTGERGAREQGARAMPWWQRGAGQGDTGAGEQAGADVTSVASSVVDRGAVPTPPTGASCPSTPRCRCRSAPAPTRPCWSNSSTARPRWRSASLTGCTTRAPYSDVRHADARHVDARRPDSAVL